MPKITHVPRNFSHLWISDHLISHEFFWSKFQNQAYFCISICPIMLCMDFHHSKSIFGCFIAIFHFWSQTSQKSPEKSKWPYVSRWWPKITENFFDVFWHQMDPENLKSFCFFKLSFLFWSWDSVILFSDRYLKKKKFQKFSMIF